MIQIFSKLPSLGHFTKMYFERWFTVFVETRSFLEQDFTFLLKLLSSSNLYITSEIEVFDAADAWMSHDFDKRKDYA